MTIRTYPPTTEPSVIEDKLHDIADGSTHVVAVELFDHLQSRYSERWGATIGPWVVGPADEVYAALEEWGYKQYDTQYELVF